MRPLLQLLLFLACGPLPACTGLTRAKAPGPLPSPAASPLRDADGAVGLAGASTPVEPAPTPGPWPEAPSTWAAPLGLRPSDTSEGTWRLLPELQAFRAAHQVQGEVELSGAFLVDPDGDGLPEGEELVRLYLGLKGPGKTQVAILTDPPRQGVGKLHQDLVASPYALAGPFFLRLPSKVAPGDRLGVEWVATPAGGQGGQGRLSLPLQVAQHQLQWRRLWWQSKAQSLEVEVEWQHPGPGLCPAGSVELLGAEPSTQALPPLGPNQSVRLGPWRFSPNPAAGLLLGKQALRARIHHEDGVVQELSSSLPLEAWRGGR